MLLKLVDSWSLEAPSLPHSPKMTHRIGQRLAARSLLACVNVCVCVCVCARGSQEQKVSSQVARRHKQEESASVSGFWES